MLCREPLKPAHESRTICIDFPTRFEHGYFIPMSQRSRAVTQWLHTPLGQHVWSAESRLVAEQIEQIFGLQALQIGTWGGTPALITHCRTQRCAVVSNDKGPGVSVYSDPAALPVVSDSVDLVVLPHTLELHERPHAVLREAQRILIGDGHLLVLGFNPYSLVGLRRVLSRGRFPANLRHLISESRLRDWMSLLGFDVLSLRRYLYTVPVDHTAAIRYTARLGSGLARVCGPAAGAYAALACKRVYTLTPIRPRWRSTTRAVGNLVEPTTRTAA